MKTEENYLSISPPKNTGIIDVNGREIYEGDIVRGGTKAMQQIGVVTWRVAQTPMGNIPCWVARNENLNYGLILMTDMNFKVEREEVIGNIKEHAFMMEPDWLKNKYHDWLKSKELLI